MQIPEQHDSLPDKIKIVSAIAVTLGGMVTMTLKILNYPKRKRVVLQEILDGIREQRRILNDQNVRDEEERSLRDKQIEELRGGMRSLDDKVDRIFTETKVQSAELARLRLDVDAHGKTQKEINNQVQTLSSNVARMEGFQQARGGR